MTIPDDDRQYLAAMQYADELENKSKKIKHDYHWIKIDETKHWNKDFLASIGPDAKIISTYVFDHNSATHCCELTSYELHLAGTDFETSSEVSDDEREEIEEKIRQGIADCGSDDIQYHHCNSIDERIEKGVKIRGRSHPISQFIGCDDVTIDEVREYYLGNPW